jgi:hypothetical protein
MVVGLCGHLEFSTMRAEGWLCGPDGVWRKWKKCTRKGLKEGWPCVSLYSLQSQSGYTDDCFSYFA